MTERTFQERLLTVIEEKGCLCRSSRCPIHGEGTGAAAAALLELERLDALWREHLNAADDNDDFGGHVGISHYHRQAARVVGDEMRSLERQWAGLPVPQKATDA